MNLCLCEIPSFDPECILTLGHLLLLLSCQINQWISTQDIFHSNCLLLCLLLPLLSWVKKQKFALSEMQPMSPDCAVRAFIVRQQVQPCQSEIILYFAFLLFSTLLLDLLQFCQKSCSVIIITVLLGVFILVILKRNKHYW